MTNLTQESATPNLDAKIRVASIAVITIASSVVVFAMIATVVAARQASSALAPTLMLPLVIAGFFALVSSVMFRRLNFQPAKLLAVFGRGGEPALAGHLFRVTLVSSALAEAVGIVGLILGIVSADTYYAYVLCGIALLAVLSNFPRARQWRELGTEITQQARSGVTGGSFGKGLE